MAKTGGIMGQHGVTSETPQNILLVLVLSTRIYSFRFPSGKAKSSVQRLEVTL